MTGEAFSFSWGRCCALTRSCEEGKRRVLPFFSCCFGLWVFLAVVPVGRSETEELGRSFGGYFLGSAEQREQWFVGVLLISAFGCVKLKSCKTGGRGAGAPCSWGLLS